MQLSQVLGSSDFCCTVLVTRVSVTVRAVRVHGTVAVDPTVASAPVRAAALDRAPSRAVCPQVVAAHPRARVPRGPRLPVSAARRARIRIVDLPALRVSETAVDRTEHRRARAQSATDAADLVRKVANDRQPVMTVDLAARNVVAARVTDHPAHVRPLGASREVGVRGHEVPETGRPVRHAVAARHREKNDATAQRNILVPQTASERAVLRVATYRKNLENLVNLKMFADKLKNWRKKSGKMRFCLHRVATCDVMDM